MSNKSVEVKAEDVKAPEADKEQVAPAAEEKQEAPVEEPKAEEKAEEKPAEKKPEPKKEEKKAEKKTSKKKGKLTVVRNIREDGKDLKIGSEYKGDHADALIKSGAVEEA